MGFPWIIAGALLARAGQSIFEGVERKRQYAAEARNLDAQAESDRQNAYIARTRAIQGDAYDRRSLSSEIASMRAIFAANGQAPNVGTYEMYRDLRDTRERERRINYANRMMEVSDYQTAAGNSARNADVARRSGRNAMLGGFLRAGPSIFDLYQLGTG